MPVQIGSRGQPDFTRPIDLMMDCHRRIEHFLAILRRVTERYGPLSLDTQGRRALDTALRYFREVAPQHTADEEQSLFPRMRSSNDDAARHALAALEHLESDHRAAERAHALVDAIGNRWLSSGRLPEHDRDTLLGLLDELDAIYAAHIRLEDDRVFPAAAASLDPNDLQQIGREMKARRATTDDGKDPGP